MTKATKHKVDKCFDELKTKAEKMGFKFEWREWVPDGYIEDADGNDTRRLITKKDTAWKLTFPIDYSRPFTMIEVSSADEASMIRSLQYSIDEYNRREEIWAKEKQISEATIRVMHAFNEKFGEGKSEEEGRHGTRIWHGENYEAVIYRRGKNVP